MSIGCEWQICEGEIILSIKTTTFSVTINVDVINFVEKIPQNLFGIHCNCLSRNKKIALSNI